MLKISIQILVLILFFNTNDSIGQEVDSSFIKDIENFQIDTAGSGWRSTLLDSFENCENYQNKFYDNFIIELSSGERVLTIEKQECDKLAKYTLNTDRVGTNSDIKVMELYIYEDTLIKSITYYDDDKNKDMRISYFKNLKFIFGTGSATVIQYMPHANDQEYVEIAKRLAKIR